MKINNGDTNRSDGQTLNGGTDWQQAAEGLYDPDIDRELTTAIVFAIADARDVPPRAIRSPPLYETVDVAAIEQALFGATEETGERTEPATVEFRYADLLVTVNSEGWIRVYESSESR